MVMRNTVEYPVTNQEKYDVIQKLLDKWNDDNWWFTGDITGMVLRDILNQMISMDPSIKHDHFSR